MGSCGVCAPRKYATCSRRLKWGRSENPGLIWTFAELALQWAFSSDSIASRRYVLVARLISVVQLLVGFVSKSGFIVSVFLPVFLDVRWSHRKHQTTARNAIQN